VALSLRPGRRAPPPNKLCNAQAGENLRLRLTGCEDSDISQGFVLCSIKNPVPMVTQFEAQLVILELLEHNPIFTVGYRSVLHIHTAVEECEVVKLVGGRPAGESGVALRERPAGSSGSGNHRGPHAHAAPDFAA
jgi:translation elongation factor EF-1alpha